MFNIFKTDKSCIFLIKFSKSRRNLVWSKHTDCFKRNSCPALVKSLGNHFVIAADYRGRKEKRIFTLYSAKVCAQAQCVKRQLCFADIILYVFFTTDNLRIILPLLNDILLCFAYKKLRTCLSAKNKSVILKFKSDYKLFSFVFLLLCFFSVRGVILLAQISIVEELWSNADIDGEIRPKKPDAINAELKPTINL